MGKNKKNKILYNVLLILLGFIPTIVLATFLVAHRVIHEHIILDTSNWIALLMSWVSSTATILLGEFVFFQTKSYHDEEKSNRKQDLKIRTAPYFSVEGIDSIEHTNYICHENNDNALFFEGKYNKGINEGETYLIRFIIKCDQNRGLNSILFNDVSFYTKFDGMMSHGDSYKFSNNENMEESEISILGNNRYQVILKLIFNKNKDMEIDYDTRMTVIKFENDILNGRNFLNINYTAENLYGISLNGVLKMQCDIDRKSKDIFEVKYLGNNSNWIQTQSLDN